MTRTVGALPTRFRGPEESPGFLLWKLSNAWQRRQRAALKPLGLTHAQFVLLATTAWNESGPPLTQARVSELSGVDAMTTSQLLRALEAAGLVQRVPHVSDPRARVITATAAGRKKAVVAVKAVEAVDHLFFAPVQGELGTLVKMFQALAAPNPDGGD